PTSCPPAALGPSLTALPSRRNGNAPWTGRELDAETGLQYNRARYYDPKTGRWTSQDPLGFDAGDSNLYRYVKNSPAIHLDPSGFFGGWGSAGTTINGKAINPFTGKWLIPNGPPGQTGFFDLYKEIQRRLPTSIQPVYFDARVAVIPLAPPAGTIEVVLFIEGDVAKGVTKDGGTGIFFHGSVGVEVSGGFGTSIGGNSGIVHGQRNWGRPRRDGQPNASAGRTYYYEKKTGKMYGSNPPIVGSKDYDKLAITRDKRSADAAVSIGDYPEQIAGDLVGRIGISGFASVGIGKYSAGAQFDLPIGEISLQRGVSLVIDQATAGVTTGMGTGARIQVYGKAYGELVIPLMPLPK
ncbi:MAG: RHS repeat-associated core domain-containing protein, partial [Nitrospiraceae bacterium]|nr:RHS repeat-associated core domain-containing protein [Nitrospiraceae bacterium]